MRSRSTTPSGSHWPYTLCLKLGDRTAVLIFDTDDASLSVGRHRILGASVHNDYRHRRIIARDSRINDRTKFE